MKVVLVYPYLNHAYFFPPFGIVYLGTFLKHNGIEVELIDLVFSKSYDEYKVKIKQAKPDIVGISTMTITINMSFEIAKITKELFPNCKVILGGPHVTAMPEHTLKNEYTDIIVIGEGEQTLLEIVRGIEAKGDLSKIKGIGYKQNGKMALTESRPFIDNLDELPMPDRELLPTFNEYLNYTTSFPFFMPCGTIIVSRGCPFNCSFCQPMLRNIFGHKVRLRSVEKVIEEIEYLIEKYNVKSIYFTDDTFWANPEWAKTVCQQIKANRINEKVRLLAQTNLATLNGERLKLMQESGFIYLGFGVESGNPIILKEVFRKSHTVEQAGEIFASCRRLGIVTSANFIIGAPQDTVTTIQDSIDLIADLDPDIKDVHYLTPTPGSALYDEYLEKGYLHYSSWTDPDRYTPELVNISGLQKGDLVKFYQQMNEAYLRPKSLWRAHPLWPPYLWNVLTATRSLKAFLRVFILQYLMMNSLFFNRLGNLLLQLRARLKSRKMKGRPCVG